MGSLLFTSSFNKFNRNFNEEPHAFLDVNREARSEDVLMKSTIESLKKTHLKMNSTITLLLRSVVKNANNIRKEAMTTYRLMKIPLKQRECM